MRTLTLLLDEDMIMLSAENSSRVGLVYLSCRSFVLHKVIKNLANLRITMSNTDKAKAAVEEGQDDDEPDEWCVGKVWSSCEDRV